MYEALYTILSYIYHLTCSHTCPSAFIALRGRERLQVQSYKYYLILQILVRVGGMEQNYKLAGQREKNELL